MIKFKFFLFFAYLTISLSVSHAQKKQMSDFEPNRVIVQYEDGSVFVGQLIHEGILDMQLRILTDDTITINKVNIKRIKRGDEDIALFDDAKFHYTKGVFYSLQLGGNSEGFDNETRQLDLTVGYRFNKKWAAGVGVGTNENKSFDFNTFIDATSTPLFAYGRFYPFDTKVRPFIAGRIGWSFGNEDSFGEDHQGGALIQPEIGINFASRRKLRFMLIFSQQFQHIKGEVFTIDQFNNLIRSRFNIWFNRSLIKLGLEWK